MPQRIVRLEEDYWRIRSDKGELAPDEQMELRAYFDEIRIPYKLGDGRPCISDVVPWEVLEERLEHFYDGRAEVYPF